MQIAEDTTQIPESLKRQLRIVRGQLSAEPQQHEVLKVWPSLKAHWKCCQAAVQSWESQHRSIACQHGTPAWQQAHQAIMQEFIATMSSTRAAIWWLKTACNEEVRLQMGSGGCSYPLWDSSRSVIAAWDDFFHSFDSFIGHSTAEHSLVTTPASGSPSCWPQMQLMPGPQVDLTQVKALRKNDSVYADILKIAAEKVQSQLQHKQQLVDALFAQERQEGEHLLLLDSQQSIIKLTEELQCSADHITQLQKQRHTIEEQKAVAELNAKGMQLQMEQIRAELRGQLATAYSNVRRWRFMACFFWVAALCCLWC